MPIGWALAHDFTAYAYGRNNLRSLPPHARLFMDGGDDTFYVLAYLTHVEGRRQDVTFNDRGGVVFANPYGERFPAFKPHDEKEARRQNIEAHTSPLPTRPLYYSTMNSQLLSGYRARSSRGAL